MSLGLPTAPSFTPCSYGTNTRVLPWTHLRVLWHVEGELHGLPPLNRDGTDRPPASDTSSDSSLRASRTTLIIRGDGARRSRPFTPQSTGTYRQRSVCTSRTAVPRQLFRDRMTRPQGHLLFSGASSSAIQCQRVPITALHLISTRAAGRGSADTATVARAGGSTRKNSR